jgi:hypothetical protein
MRQAQRVLDELDAMLDRLKAREPRDWTVLDAYADPVSKVKALSHKGIRQFGRFGRWRCVSHAAGLSVNDDALHGSATHAGRTTATVTSLSYTVQSVQTVQPTSVGIVNQRLGFGHLGAPTVQKRARIVQDRHYCEAAVVCWLASNPRESCPRDRCAYCKHRIDDHSADAVPVLRARVPAAAIWLHVTCYRRWEKARLRQAQAALDLAAAAKDP